MASRTWLRGTIAALVLLCAGRASATPPRSTAAPAPGQILFPPTPRGPAEWRDERDVAPYLAAWKAQAFDRAYSLRSAATPNQQAYDVHWYDLDLAFTPATSQVAGTVRMQASVVEAPLTTVDLDLLANMVVDQVQAGRCRAPFPAPAARVAVSPRA